MANPTTDIPSYWDRYAQGVTPEDPEEALATALEWTQYPGHGPGFELLGEPASALELGAGRGNAVAALASRGVRATGVDVSPVAVEHARHQWAHLGAEFHHADVVEFLTGTGQRWDAVYSVWGAAWFTDPDVLFPLVHDRLEPGGGSCSPAPPRFPGRTEYRACTEAGSTAAGCGSTGGPTNPRCGRRFCLVTGSVRCRCGRSRPRRLTMWEP